MSAVADEVLDGLGPGLSALAGPLLPPVVGALTEPLAHTGDLLATAPGRPGPALFDLATSPYPHNLGQAAGLQVPRGLDTEQARAYVAGRGVSRRGTAVALKAAVAAVLTGSRTVVLRERDTSPYHATVITYAGETPDPARVLAAAQGEKPIGLVLTHAVADGISWDQLAAEPEADFAWDSPEGEATTWSDLGLLVPNQQEG